jgi:hypothetical protein
MKVLRHPAESVTSSVAAKGMPSTVLPFSSLGVYGASLRLNPGYGTYMTVPGSAEPGTVSQ